MGWFIMWIQCSCGHQIKDTDDSISYKARYISDQDWFGVLDNIDSNIQSPEPNKDKLCHDNRKFLLGKVKNIYQCTDCGRLYIEDSNRELREYLPLEEGCGDVLHS